VHTIEMSGSHYVFGSSALKRRVGTPGVSPNAAGEDKASGWNSDASFRLRKAHSKSRFGCKNCKSRRLKCDELRSYDGGCQRCSSAGLQCDYILFTAKPLGMRGTKRASFPRRNDSTRLTEVIVAESKSGVTPSSSHDGALSIPASRQSSPLIPQISWSPHLSASEVSLAGSPSSKQVFYHFSTMTARTVGDYKSQSIAQSKVIATALHSPYLMNAILGLAAAHLRYLLPPEASEANKHLRIAECAHWAKAFDGFRQELAGSQHASAQMIGHQSNVNRFNMDQLLSTVMFVSMHQFSLRDDSGALTGQEGAPCSFVWLSSRDARDRALKWLGVQAGFKGLLPAMQPWLTESFWLPIFGAVNFSDEFSLEKLGVAASCADNHSSANMDQTDFEFVKLCGVDSNSSTCNPYFSNLEILLWCRRLRPITAESFTKLLNFVARMPAGFQNLLLDLDTAALLILAHWLTLLHEIGQWWIVGRCEIEIREIVRFLTLREGSKRQVRILLCEPAAAVGMVV
jgi:hypothetical protein